MRNAGEGRTDICPTKAHSYAACTPYTLKTRTYKAPEGGASNPQPAPRHPEVSSGPTTRKAL